ncbi:MAG: hypothetical protein ACPHAS_03640 [Synechococcus sp.]
MRLFLPTVAVLIAGATSPVHAAIFTVREGTQFYAKPTATDDLRLELPEVRVHVPPQRDVRGFCRFKLVYKIADRGNPELPTHGWARCMSTDALVPTQR